MCLDLHEESESVAQACALSIWEIGTEVSGVQRNLGSIARPSLKTAQTPEQLQSHKELLHLLDFTTGISNYCVNITKEEEKHMWQTALWADAHMLISCLNLLSSTWPTHFFRSPLIHVPNGHSFPSSQSSPIILYSSNRNTEKLCLKHCI